MPGSRVGALNILLEDEEEVNLLDALTLKIDIQKISPALFIPSWINKSFLLLTEYFL
jgi:hypothetical protein